jgi:hypothetical protein
MEKFTTVKEALTYLQAEFADDSSIDMEML